MTKQAMINDFEKRSWRNDEGIKAMLMKRIAVQTKQIMINDFEERYWNIDEGIKAMLMKQTAVQLSAKLTEWADFAEQPRLEF